MFSWLLYYFASGLRFTTPTSTVKSCNQYTTHIEHTQLHLTVPTYEVQHWEHIMKHEIVLVLTTQEYSRVPGQYWQGFECKKQSTKCRVDVLWTASSLKCELVYQDKSPLRPLVSTIFYLTTWSAVFSQMIFKKKKKKKGRSIAIEEKNLNVLL